MMSGLGVGMRERGGGGEYDNLWYVHDNLWYVHIPAI